MESLDNILISFLDIEANKGLFRKELSELLHIPIENIYEPYLESKKINGVVKQYIYIHVYGMIPRDDLMNIPFDYISEGCIVFEVGDTIL